MVRRCTTLTNVFISDVVRLVWLLNRFSEDVDFSHYSDFLLRSAVLIGCVGN